MRTVRERSASSPADMASSSALTYFARTAGRAPRRRCGSRRAPPGPWPWSRHRSGNRAGRQRGLPVLASSAGGALSQRVREDFPRGARREGLHGVPHYEPEVVLVQRGGKPHDGYQRRQQGQRDLEGERTRMAETVGGAKAGHRVGEQAPPTHPSQSLEGLVALQLTPGRWNGCSRRHGRAPASEGSTPTPLPARAANHTRQRGVRQRPIAFARETEPALSASGWKPTRDAGAEPGALWPTPRRASLR